MLVDLTFVLIALGFMALCVAYVRGLDRIVRSSEDTDPGTESRAGEVTR